jgi:GNAT superfamily N-acetyltransferase
LFNENDIEKISNFLGYFAKSDIEINSCRKVTWDCFSKHPCFKMFHPEKIGIWENEGEIVGVVRLESPWDGGVIIDVNPNYVRLHDDMIHYAEESFAGTNDSGNKYLNVFIREADRLQDTLMEKGYSRGAEGRMLSFDLAEMIPTTELPLGFHLISLQEAYSFEKLNELLWRAFNYEGEPPSFDDDVYLPIKHAWLDYKREICIVAVAPDNSFASFCGMWFDEETKSASIEPLATAQRHRSIGLARACIYKSMEKCKNIGAKIVYVEPDAEALEWYKKIGFKEAFKGYCWSKHNL